MIETIHMIGLTSSLLSLCVLDRWRRCPFRPLSLFTLRGPDSIPAALQLQSLFNACAAIFAAGVAGSQAVVFYLQIPKCR